MDNPQGNVRTFVIVEISNEISKEEQNKIVRELRDMRKNPHLIVGNPRDMKCYYGETPVLYQP